MTRSGLAALLLTALPLAAGAHPLGNVTTNRQAALAVGRGELVVRYVVDLAELPAFRALAEMDADGDGGADARERDGYAARLTSEIARGFHLTMDGRPLVLAARAHSAEVLPGAGGLPTLRVELHYQAVLEADRGTVEVRDDNFAGLPGWHGIVAAGSRGVALAGSTVPSIDPTDALRHYPEDALAAPPQVRSARFGYAPGVAPDAAPTAPGARADAERFGDRLTALMADRRPLSASVMLRALALAAMLGAFHALTPGHGKTVVAAYLVGARGTWRHAVFLGLVVTATHTLGVYALGLGTLAASSWVLPERILPWLGAASGLLVVAVGASLLRQRLEAAFHGHAHGPGHHHDHPHGHSHLPPDGARADVRSLLALGVSGGLLPCPSALVVMLGAIALGRTAFGLALILAFSTGLAAVLTAIGVTLVHARGLFDRLPLDGRLARLMPVASAAVISIAGLAIVVQALAELGA